MTHDLVLRLRRALFGSLRLEIGEPANLEASEGRLAKPPPAWSAERRYFAGDPDVASIRGWLHDSLGGPLVRAISGYATGPARLFVVAAEEMPEVLATPWEVLEESHGDLQVGEQLSVIRSFECRTNVTPPEAIPVALRLLITCANPDGDIPDFEEHLDDLRALEKTTDDAVSIEVVEFSDYAAVQKAGAAFLPNVVYHFGHAEPPAPKVKVALRVGLRGNRNYVDGAQYAQLVRSFSPNLFVLNACAAVSGHDLNPYLGIARETLGAAPAVVCMQTKVPSGASQRFSGSLFGDLAAGVQLSQAMRRARLAMVQGQVSGSGGLPLFTRFIPVQLACGTSDPSFTLAETELSRRRLRNRLKSHLETTRRLLPRSFDQPVDDLLANGAGVAVIIGPKACGKSTTLRARVRARIESATDSRCLYYRVEGELPDPNSAARQLLAELTAPAQYGWLTASLRARIAEKREPDAHREIAELATWLSEESGLGRRYVIVIDDLPPALAADIAGIAAGVIDKGLLVLVTREAPSVDVRRVDFSYMSEAEIAAATGDASAASALRERTGGVPYLVVAELEGQSVNPEFLDSYLQTLSDDALHAVQLAALSRTPIPREWLEIGDEAVAVLNETSEGLAIVELVRDVVTFDSEQEAALRGELHDLFVDASAQRVRGPVEIARRRRWKEEGVHQALELAKLFGPESEAADECLRNALELSLDLHYESIVEIGDAVSAKAMWERHRDVSIDLDREAETAYGEALAEVGELDHADHVLEGVTGTGARDRIQVQALLLRSNIIKRSGKSGAFATRRELLNEAREVVLELVERRPDDEALLELHGDVEQSLGNLLAYGSHADTSEAEQHLKEAVRIFAALGDLREYRASAEIIEMRRYNRLMTEAECAAAIETIIVQLDQLAVRSMREDAVRHRYELGRLEPDPRRRAKWFGEAFQTAGDSYAPLNWLAAVQWKLAEIEAGDAVDDDVVRYAAKLAQWSEDVWCQRVRRRALFVNGRRAIERGEAASAAALLAEAWQIVESRYADGEGRGDAAARMAIAVAIDQLARSGTAFVNTALLRDTLEQEVQS